MGEVLGLTTQDAAGSRSEDARAFRRRPRWGDRKGSDRVVGAEVQEHLCVVEGGRDAGSCVARAAARSGRGRGDLDWRAVFDAYIGEDLPGCLARGPQSPAIGSRLAGPGHVEVDAAEAKECRAREQAGG